jgi:hypothetical protein
MKKSVLIMVVPALLLTILLSSCAKPDHSVRIKSNFYKSAKVTVGPNDYGMVATGSTTEYKNVPEGKNTIGGDFVGEYTFQGNGEHKWTLTIANNGDFSSEEDF